MKIRDKVFRDRWAAVHSTLLSTEARFLLVGAWNTVAGYLIFVTIYFAAGDTVSTLAVLSTSYALSLTHAFATQKFLVFRSSGESLPEFLRFASTNTIIFLANLLFLPLAIQHVELHPIALQGVFLLISTVASYFVHKNYSFSR